MNKIIYTIAAALLMLCSCSKDELQTEYTPQGDTTNSHLTAQSGGEEQPGDDDEPGEDVSGTLADQLSTAYTGTLRVIVDGEEASTSEETIDIVKRDGTHIDFMLKNFVLSDGIDVMPVGTIRMDEIVLTEENGKVHFEKEEGVLIADGDAEGVELWMGPYIGVVPVQISGTATKDGMNAVIDINLESLGQIIHVDFQGTYKAAAE